MTFNYTYVPFTLGLPLIPVREWKGREAGEDCTIRSFITCTLPQIFFGWSNQERWGGRGM